MNCIIVQNTIKKILSLQPTMVGNSLLDNQFYTPDDLING